ncbi:MAG TPA: helix-turn-helix domain-containing protein [Pseudonocardia sp.]|nr:helix-turn-helix domain-containing protein [Pseudonocardia sp.]
MSVIVDTSTVPAQYRFDYWADAHGRVLHPLELRRPGRDPFTGRIRAHRVGAVTLFHIEGDASAIRRTARLVARHDPEELQVTNLVRGRFRIEQGARTALVGAGDLSCYETSHAYEVTSPGPFELLLFSLPKALLGERADAVCARTAVALDGRTGAAALAGPFLRGIAERIEDGSLDAGATGLSDCVVDVVRLLFTADRPDAANPEAPRLFPRVVAYIDAHLGDPDLGPRPVAAAHFVSVRQLHKVFECEGRTVAGWIRARRLAAVRRDLADPGLAELPIRVLAARRGFVDAPHFNRLFRAEQGCTPGEFRRHQLSS